MWKHIWDWILKQFGIEKSQTDERQLEENVRNAMEYSSTESISFNAIFSNRLARLATADSDFVLAENNRRAELLNKVGTQVWGNIKKMVALSLGTGGCLIIPYVQNGELRYDIASQDRLHINRKQGEKITAATVLADSVVLDKVRYFRFTDYKIEDGNLIITNKVINEQGRPATVDQWSEIEDMRIGNVNRVPFGFIKSPVDNRRCADDYGVPITYGCKKIIYDIFTCLKQIEDEFALKEVRLQVDGRAFNKDKNGNPILTSKLFIAGDNPKNENMFNVFDPAIRESSYYTRLTHLFELLEKTIGTSRGILTKQETTYENLEAIRAANRDTWSLITDIRTSIESAFEDFLYACDVLANFCNLSPVGEYTFSFDWDYSIIERTADTWQQLKDAQSIGIRSKAELRAWQTGESLEEAQKAIDEIAVKEPGLRDLLGVND